MRRTKDKDDEPNLNTGEAWLEMDLLDLANCVRLKQPIKEIADFMCRTQREISERLAELQQSGELAGLIEKAAAEAVEEPDAP